MMSKNNAELKLLFHQMRLGFMAYPSGI